MASAAQPLPTHAFMVKDCKFVLDVKYTPQKLLGRGAYGVVCSALDSSTNTKVAIKKIPKAFEDLVDAKRIVREVKLLRHFRHENIIGLLDMMNPPLDEVFDDIYMIMDFMETDLHKIIYSKNELSDDHVQYFMWQLLRGMKYIHSAHVIHRDLKPSNLLLNQNCDLKICDFGLARGTKGSEEFELTEYVVTRWYRAPEVMVSCQDYDFRIDTWAIGCIMAELFGKKPIFPGDDYVKQINLIIGTLGSPTAEDCAFISNKKALEYIQSLPKKVKKPWSQVYPKASAQALDLLDKLLQFSPRKRISIDEALAHPYLASLHQDGLQDTCQAPFNFDFEKQTMTKDVLRELIWEEVLKFRPALTKIYKKGKIAGPGAAGLANALARVNFE